MRSLFRRIRVIKTSRHNCQKGEIGLFFPTNFAEEPLRNGMIFASYLVYINEQMIIDKIRRLVSGNVTLGRIVFFSFLAMSGCSDLQAQYYWDNDNSNGYWSSSDAANWHGDINPPDYADVVFDDSYVSNSLQYVYIRDGDKIISNMCVSGSSPSYQFIEQSSTEDIVFDTNGNGSSLLQIGRSVFEKVDELQFDVGIYLQNDLTVYMNDVNNLVFNKEIVLDDNDLIFDGSPSENHVYVYGEISGTGAVINNGVDNGGVIFLNLQGDNSFSGGLIVDEGGRVNYYGSTALDIGYSDSGNSAFGVGDIVVRDGGVLTARTTSNKNIRVGGNLTFEAGSQGSLIASNNCIFKSSSDVTINGTSNVSVEADEIQMQGSLTLNESTLELSTNILLLDSTALIDGGSASTKGTLYYIGDGGYFTWEGYFGDELVVDTPTLINNPNITIETQQTTPYDPILSIVAEGTSASLTGIGTLTKTEVGQLRIDSSITNLQAITIDIQGGSILLGADNQIADTTNMILSGGTFETGGYDETLGTLTLSADSTIDLGSGSDSVLHLADSSGETWSGSLTISNWDGSDQLFFGSSSSGLQSSQVAQIWFENPGNMIGTYQGMILDTGEIVPLQIVPEPATWISGLILLGFIAFVYRKKMRGVAGLSKVRAAE